jgi:hypothetical protein
MGTIMGTIRNWQNSEIMFHEKAKKVEQSTFFAFKFHTAF